MYSSLLAQIEVSATFRWACPLCPDVLVKKAAGSGFCYTIYSGGLTSHSRALLWHYGYAATTKIMSGALRISNKTLESLALR
jgi:hypothetical protein